MRAIGILQPKILRIPHLAAFLAPWGVPMSLRAATRPGVELGAIAGWGYRPTALPAREEAALRDLPYLALEDGFLRSVDLGASGAPPWSIVVDDLGIYYDASAPSRLETLIAGGTRAPDDTVTLIDLIRANNLSKYNNAPDLADTALRDDARPLVIVLDQTLGDVSIAAGGADTASFEAMLDAAVTENPRARVILRVHPDVIAGHRRGYLDRLARRRGIEIMANRVSWPSLARRAAKVYTATSQAGLEALIVGVPVVCFGLPFYAGWGLTDDRLPCPRRIARPSLAALVAAAYQLYPRYIDPIDGHACDAVTAAKRLAAARRRGE